MNIALNHQQRAILKLLYRFRFATIPLLAQYCKPKNRQSLNSRLDILTRDQYIGRKYDSSYKLLGKPAMYYLLPKSFPLLKKEANAAPSALKNFYKDPGASASFIARQLALFALSNNLQAKFGTNADLFTRSELKIGYDHFPQPLPDGFITLQSAGSLNCYFVELLDNSMPFRKIKEVVSKYIEYDDWDTSIAPLPSALLICLHLRVRKQAANLIERLEDEMPEGLHIFVVSEKGVLSEPPLRAMEVSALGLSIIMCKLRLSSC